MLPEKEVAGRVQQLQQVPNRRYNPQANRLLLSQNICRQELLSCTKFRVGLVEFASSGSCHNCSVTYRTLHSAPGKGMQGLESLTSQSPVLQKRNRNLIFKNCVALQNNKLKFMFVQFK